MKQNLHNIFNSGACPGSDDLQQYLRGAMSPEDANALEQHVEGCEMCADALEGLQAMKNVNSLATLKADLDNRVDALLKEEKQSVLFSGWYKIAAAVAILVMVGTVLYMNNQFSDKNQKVFTEHYKPFEKKEDKVKTLQQKVTSTEESNKVSSPSINSVQEMIVEEDVNVVEDVAENNFKNIEAEQLSANRNELAKPAAPPALDIYHDLDVEVKEEVNLESKVDGMISADEVNVRGGRENATDYYIDGIKVQSDENIETTAMRSDKSRNTTAIQEVTVAKDSKSKKAVARKENSDEAQVEKSTAIGNSEDAFLNGESVELISVNYVKGEEEYKNKNYEQASLWFQKVLELDAGHYQSNFYAGLCALQLEQAEISVDYLNMVIDKEKEVLYEPALWYISLAHIKLDESRKAKKYLKMIIPLNGEYKTEAEKLLEEL